MFNPAMAQVQVEPLVGGVRYVLPQRDLGRARRGGWALVAMGLFVTGFMLLWMGVPIFMGIKLLREGHWTGLLPIGFGCLGLIGLAVGLGMLGAGLAIAANATRCVVELRDGRLWSIEKVGPFRWKRKRPIEQIRQLVIGPAITGPFMQRLTSRRGRPNLSGQVNRLVSGGGLAILLQDDRGEPFKVAPGYERTLLVALAEDLAERIGAARPAGLVDGEEEPAVRVVESAGAGGDEAAPPWDAPLPPVPQPQGNNAVLEERSDGLTITIPPAGLWKGSKGLFFFAILWNGFCAVFITMIVLALAGKLNKGDISPAVGLLFMIPFVGVGIGMTLAAVNMGRRMAIIDVVGQTLVITRRTLFGTKQREWTADRIQQVTVGPSGMKVNDRSILELQVHTVDGKKFSCLSQRSDAELAWIAAQLARAIKPGG